jgi:hypothetical protein
MRGSLGILSAALGKLLSPPVIFFSSILKNIDQEVFLIQRLYSSGQGINLGRVFGLLKWCALALFILGICLFLIVDTVRRVMFAEKKQRGPTAILLDVMAVGLVLFLYYSVVSIALLFLFNVAVPVMQSL